MTNEQINYEELEKAKKMTEDSIPDYVKEVVDYYKPNIKLVQDDTITIFVLYLDEVYEESNNYIEENFN